MVVCDIDMGQAWLVPQINLILLMIRLYMTEVRLSQPLKIEYPSERNSDREFRDLCAWAEISRLENLRIEEDASSTTSTKTFGGLFNDYCEEIHEAIEALHDYGHLHRSRKHIWSRVDGCISPRHKSVQDVVPQ